jgi:hypothetical protein
MEEKRLFKLAEMWLAGSGASFGLFGSDADY